MVGVQINYILQQKTVPVAIRMGTGHPLTVRVPYATDNMAWLQAGRRNRPKWKREQQEWEIPASWFNGFVDRALSRYGKLYVIQPYREMEKCADACMNAQGHECQCSCMGANHGSGGGHGWFKVNEAFSFRWGVSTLACRLMEKR